MEIEAPSNEPGWDEKWCAQEKMEKNAKRERDQYLAILTELAWSIKDLLYGI